MKPKQSFFKKVLNGSGCAFFAVFVWELLEELLENALAYAITSVVALFIAKLISTFTVVLATQGIKTVIKTTLLPYVKKIIYKEGNDKMEKFKKILSTLWANKCTIGGTIAGALTVASGTGIIDVASLPAIVIGAVNITPSLYYAILGIAIVIFAFFPETLEAYKKRVAEKKAQKEEKAILRQAKKELANEEKIANETQTEEKEKAEAEYRAKVDAVKEQLKAEIQIKQSE